MAPIASPRRGRLIPALVLGTLGAGALLLSGVVVAALVFFSRGGSTPFGASPAGSVPSALGSTPSEEGSVPLEEEDTEELPSGFPSVTVEPPFASSAPLGILPPGANVAATTPADATALLPISPVDPIRGDSSALVTLVLYGDLSDTLTARAVQMIPQLEHYYGNTLRVVFKVFPLKELGVSQQVAEAALAVQGIGGSSAFWKFVEAVAQSTDPLASDHLETFGSKVGLPAGSITHALLAHSYTSAVRKNVAEGLRFDVFGAPTWFYNGRRVNGGQTVEVLRERIDGERTRAAALLATVPPAQIYARRVFLNVTSAEGEESP